MFSYEGGQIWPVKPEPLETENFSLNIFERQHQGAEKIHIIASIDLLPLAHSTDPLIVNWHERFIHNCPFGQ